MKQQQSVFVLIYRVLVIALALYLTLKWFIDTVQGSIEPLLYLLTLWFGAWFWESVMYIWNRWIKE